MKEFIRTIKVLISAYIIFASFILPLHLEYIVGYELPYIMILIVQAPLIIVALNYLNMKIK